MAWKRQWTSKSIDVDVDLDEFSSEELLQGLIDRKWLSTVEAEAIKNRITSNEKSKECLLLDASTEDIEIARVEARRGRCDEAMIYLARALGRDFDPIFNN